MNGDKAMLATAYRYFLAVAEAGSIRGASDELNVAASAVNRQVLQFEAALGIPLFERVGRGLRLSEAGRVLRTHLRRAVTDYQGVISELDALRGLQRGKVSLATVESVSVTLLPEILAAFWATLPGIEVTARIASSDTVTQLVRSRDADLGYTFNPPSLGGLKVIYERAFTIFALVAAGHPLAGRRTLTLADCLDFPIALPARGLSLRAALEPALAATGKEIRPRLESNSLRIMANLARHESCIAFQTVVGIERELEADDLVVIALTDPEIAIDRLMVIHEDQRVPNIAVSTFMDFLVAQLNDRKLRTIWLKHAVCRRNWRLVSCLEESGSRRGRAATGRARGLGRLTTHVLDTAQGRPADGLVLELWSMNDMPEMLKTATTNSDGRVDSPLLEGDDLSAGVYELRFLAGDYLKAVGVSSPEPAFLDVIPIRFGISDETVHYHVPLLLSPYGYATYRGS